MAFEIDLDDLDLSVGPDAPGPEEDDEEPGYYPMLISAE